IELMRAVGERSHDTADAGRADASVRVGSPAAALRMLTRLQQLATAANTPDVARFRLDAITKLAQMNAASLGMSSKPGAAQAPLPPGPRMNDGGGVQPLLLPMAVGS